MGQINNTETLVVFIQHYVSRVRCHVLPVMCHVLRVTCQQFFFTFFFYKKKLSFKKIGQSGGASRWRVCYQRGLPRLVLAYFGLFC